MLFRSGPQDHARRPPPEFEREAAIFEVLIVVYTLFGCFEDSDLTPALSTAHSAYRKVDILGSCG